MEEEELWEIIDEFPDYEISNLGRVFLRGSRRYMRVSYTNHGHAKISLSKHDGRYTRSVALLVARAFVEPPDYKSDSVVLLNGDLSDVRASNIVWRPVWFGWKYTRQLKDVVQGHYVNLKVTNMGTGVEYNSIVEAGMTEGLLFDDIWRSTYTGRMVYPSKNSFEITERV